jgi:hypothetical protein
MKKKKWTTVTVCGLATVTITVASAELLRNSASIREKIAAVRQGAAVSHSDVKSARTSPEVLLAANNNSNADENTYTKYNK